MKQRSTALFRLYRMSVLLRSSLCLFGMPASEGGNGWGGLRVVEGTAEGGTYPLPQDPYWRVCILITRIE